MYLRRFLLLLFACCAVGPPALMSQASGTITTTSTSTNCPGIDASRMATVAIQVTGTWTGTLTPGISVAGQPAQPIQVTPANSQTPQTTITANNVYYAAGGGIISVCGPTSSGTANIYFQPVPGTARGAPGGGSGGGFTAALDLTGTPSSQKVVGLHFSTNAFSLCSTDPTAGQFLFASSSSAICPNSLLIDSGTVFSYAGTGGITAPVLGATGSGAGLNYFTQGADNSASCPANSDCEEAPASISTSFTRVRESAGPSVTSVEQYAPLSGGKTAKSFVNTLGAGNFLACGPGPWIDVTCYGAKGDGLYNNTGGTSTTSGTTTVTTSSGATLFAATDCSGGSGCTGTVNKLIAFPAGGLATPTLGTVSTAAGSLTLPHACFFITAIQDNATLPITSGAPSINGESLPTAESCTALTAQNLTMTAPTLPTNATGYRVYFADEASATVGHVTSGMVEVSQIIPGTAYAGCTQTANSSRNVRDGACDPGSTLTISAYTYIGFLPPQKAGWLSTIASFVSTTSVTITDAIPSDIGGHTTEVAWGTANDAAYASALAACPNNAGIAILKGNGCTLFFPPVGTQASPATFTGRYASQNGITVLQDGVILKTPGSVDALPNSGNSTLYNNWGTTSLWVMGRSYGLQWGSSAASYQGGGTEQANIEDMSGVGYGALFVTAPAGGATSDHLQFRRLYGTNFFSGTCITLGNVQILEFDHFGCLSEAGIMGEDFVSNNQFSNGDLVGAINSYTGAGWGVLLESNPATTQITGGNQFHDMKIRDFYQGHYRLKNAQTTQVFESKDENIAMSGGASCSGGTACYGTMIQMDDVTNSGRSFLNQFVGGTWARAVSFFNIGVNSFNNTILETGAEIISGTVCTDNGTNDDILVGGSLSVNCVNKFNGSLSTLPGTQRLVADSSPITATTAGTAVAIFTFGSFAANAAYSFHCSGTTTQATAGAGIGIAFKANATAPTNMEAHALVNTSATAINGQSSGNVTSTTITAIYTGVTGTVTTQLPWYVDGSIETGSTAPTALTINFFSISSSDAVTVKRDSFCTIGL
jgi:hypothetical protein